MVVWGVVVRAIVVVGGGAYPESFRSISLFLWSYKDIRNNVVVMGVVVVGVVVGGLAVGVVVIGVLW